MFCIDKTKLKPEGRKIETMAALYAAIYTEFSGANENKQYEDLTNFDRVQLVNEFALNWLKKRGLI